MAKFCVRIEPLSATATRTLGLTEEAIRNHVYLSLKSRLARLPVERYTGANTGACDLDAPDLWGTIAIGQSSEGAGYHGLVQIELIREALWESGRAGRGIAYSYGTLIAGSVSTLRQQVYQVLEGILADFAAEYSRAGNP